MSRVNQQNQLYLSLIEGNIIIFSHINYKPISFPIKSQRYEHILNLSTIVFQRITANTFNFTRLTF